MTRLEFLESTIKYYGENPERRCQTEGSCYYSPITSGKESISKGCAIGRLIDPGLAREIDTEDNTQGVSISGVFRIEKYKNRLPMWMQKMNIDFLEEVQSLHDDNIYWDESGLSEAGHRKINTIKYNFKLQKI